MEIEFGKFIPKGWGYEFWICNTPLYCGKVLFFKKGKKCSWHYHMIKDETFYIQSGKLVLWYLNSDEADADPEIADVKILKEGDIFHVPPRMRHQMMGAKDTVMYEISTYHTEEDSIKLIRGDQIT